MVAPEPPRLRRSVSQLTSFSQCSEAYRLQKVAKAPQRPAAWYAMGRAAHKAIEDYENSGRSQTAPELVEVFNEAYDAEINADLLKWPDWDSWLTGGRKGGEQDVADRRVIGAYQVEQYIEYALENAAVWRVIASEVEFEIEIGGVITTGFMDQIRQHVDGSLEVADPKGGSTVPGSGVQLAVYGRAVEEHMGVRPTRACFIKLARPATTRGKAKPTTELHHDLSQWPDEMLDRMFRDFDKAERQGLYLPNPTEDCHRTCGVAQYCSIPLKGHMESAAQFINIRSREDYLANLKEVA
ncbi:PD-(D/E)XK nuclease family protein [Arthrobacter sp. ISL-95]|uniref:PD-(D/E)XK nuclease family protein n=1 Tax=Arthrobacter sp. ISL-95 TaxID=2819116 RepID=UPI001BE8217C|nr:PD-(D/E)XK nuclease family protein [Arthrobacter sp. ISL-95]MBT2587988.1 PD-(D/E)XK nuclease family protein [Arthrobacter sp. ISL-95]